MELEIARIEEELRPMKNQAAEAMTARSRIEKELGLHQRIQELEEVRAGLVADGAVPGGRPTGSIPAGTVATFDRAIERALEAWQVRLHGVSYDQLHRGAVRGRPCPCRPWQGHARSAARRVRRLTGRLLPGQRTPPPRVRHPRLPLVTYRQPGGARRSDDENLPDSVIDYFYRDLFHRFTGQAIVVENSDPPADIVQDAQVYMFRRVPHDHRFGFFPIEAAT
ncbi:MULTISPECIES: hypothetical protein [Streptomyces]|uniref:hypothetical protein n=1 Tax=Streptomyces TaxID=1883 RepID=UPI0011610987|nr:MULTISPECIES: hypothetical protein [unclassified Streptomyces]QNQ38507.1 hypothetical protein HYC88_35560 [Streptomyces sp. CB00271]